MIEHIRVKGKDDLVRTIPNNMDIAPAVINTNHTAYQVAKKRAAEAQKQRDEIRGATREINNLKCEMHEIKSMLKTLLERN
jgi:hypothetical protein